MKRFKRYKDYGFFDQDIRLSKLSQLGDPLEKLNAGVDFEMYRSLLDIHDSRTVWLFQDQGILRKAEKPVDTSNLTCDVWIDSLHYYNITLDGADGVVYPDRTPQADYWQLRKVYSPVQIIETEIPVNSGQQNLTFTMCNQYDFTNLNTLNGTWKLYKNHQIVQRGKIATYCAPHDTVSFSLPVEIPENPDKTIWFIQFEYKDKNGISVYDHSVELISPSGYDAFKSLICNNSNGKIRNVKNDENTIVIDASDFKYHIEKNKFQIKLMASGNKNPLLNSEVYARTGRCPKIADVTVRDKFTPETGDYFWDPWLLNPRMITSFSRDNEKDGYQINAKETFLRGENFPGQNLNGEFQYSIKNTGALNIAYNLVPDNASGASLEAGISLILPAEICNFYWVGNGPYASYPDKKHLNDFGIHQIHKNDINFNGNRTNVKIAVLTDKTGNGIAILGNTGNTSVELKNNQIVVSHECSFIGCRKQKEYA